MGPPGCSQGGAGGLGPPGAASVPGTAACRAPGPTLLPAPFWFQLGRPFLKVFLSVCPAPWGQMPGRLGFALLPGVRTTPATSWLPVLMWGMSDGMNE